MIKEALKSALIGAVFSTIATIIIVGFVIGEKGIPTTVMANVIGNIPTAVFSAGISGFAATITTFKLFEKKNQQ